MTVATIDDTLGVRVLNEDEIGMVTGGWFWLALPIIIGAGYTLGKDRAERDNARDEAAREAAEKAAAK